LPKKLEKGAKIEAKTNIIGDTALIFAARNGNKECISLLLKNGANVDEKNNNGDTALTVAACNGQKECISLLLEKGANIKVKNNGHHTALFLATYRGHKECISLLQKNERISKNKKMDAKFYSLYMQRVQEACVNNDNDNDINQ
jgi:ankyrin repeat protein